MDTDKPGSPLDEVELDALIADLDRMAAVGDAAREDPVLRRHTDQLLGEMERRSPGSVQRMRNGLAMLAASNVSVEEALGAPH
ncbi:hypothetical protein [Brevundimonas nasdae]|uniref:hypothetical protein n=1 Tax=Brevundimonas nasdae TaxID=172043 RepID=UPI003F693CD7